ncbi:MAG: LysM peptidoglycan-binding domain-containing protein [Pseudomonadota bacterium]
MAKISSSAVGRRNFRLSPLEILITVLIFVGVLYLLTLWSTNLMTPGEEAAAPVAPPGALVERALVASEKVLAEQSSMGREVGSLRKQVEALQAQARKTHGAGSADPTDAAQDRRLDEVDRRLDELGKHGGRAPDLQPLVARLDKLEKELAVRPATPAAPVSDPQVLARLTKLEKELAARPAAPAAPAASGSVSDPQVMARLDKLEKDLAARPTASPNPAAAALVQQEGRLQRLESGLQETREGLNRPRAPQADAQVLERLAKLEKALALHQVAPAPPPPVVKAPSATTQAPKAEARTASKPSRGEGDTHRISHKVRPGETLGGLARRYKVSMDDIVRWNYHQLGTRRMLLKGESLVIYSGQNS